MVYIRYLVSLYLSQVISAAISINMEFALGLYKCIFQVFVCSQDLLIQSSELDKIRPGYGATLVISSSDKLFSASVPCHGIVLTSCRHKKRRREFSCLAI